MPAESAPAALTGESLSVATDPAPIVLALDAPDAATALQWAAEVAPYVSTMKIGLESYLRDGRHLVEAVREASGARDVFLDLKLHDIPNTVAGAARSVAPLSPRYVTVHATGGSAMIRAAVDALPDTLVTAVTLLTSMSEADIEAIGYRSRAAELVLRLAVLAVEAGARAIVCSPQEVSAVRSVVGEAIVLITPGVRPAGSSAQDQARVSTPGRALVDGADLLVIGRPITGAESPARAAQSIAASIGNVPRRPGRG